MEKKFTDGLVSVVIPVYNSAKYIDRTLNSIFTQTYKNIEIVMVNDQSQDDSADVIAKYLFDHQEIVYHLQEKNMGAAVARNIALGLAKGQYVAFLDSDDEWLPEKIERQINLMNKTGAAFSFTAIEMIDEKDQLIKSKRNIRERVNYNFLLHNTMIATSSVVVDRSKLGDFKMPLRRGGQDYATWLKLLRGGTIAYGINEPFVRYRISRNSLSSNKLKSINQVWEIQTQDEKIGKITTAFNVFCFALNALKKYLL